MGNRVTVLPTTAATVLAIDGGNSKTDFVLLTTAGEVLARARSGPFLPHLIGAADAVESFTVAIAEVMTMAGLGQIGHIAAYLANADLDIETERIHAAIEQRAWARTTVVENDTFAVLRAGTERGFGVAVVCGAGINCVGVAPDGGQVRFPALGRITGDWGGGLGLAEETLWWSVRAEDGRGEPTALSHLVAQHFSSASASSVAEQFHLGTLPAVRRYEIVERLFDAATAGDAVALSIVRRQATEIATLVTTTVRRLGQQHSSIDVVLGGGILAAGDEVLLGPLSRALNNDLPLAQMVFLCDPPVTGAALLGLEQAWMLGAPCTGGTREEALDRVRSQLRPAVSAASALCLIASETTELP
jgi:N-acetylglucosamine kinase-like BadF-type ATPase